MSERELKMRNSTAEFLIFTRQATIRNFRIVHLEGPWGV